MNSNKYKFIFDLTLPISYSKGQGYFTGETTSCRCYGWRAVSPVNQQLGLIWQNVQQRFTSISGGCVPYSLEGGHFTGETLFSRCCDRCTVSPVKHGPYRTKLNDQHLKQNVPSGAFLLCFDLIGE